MMLEIKLERTGKTVKKKLMARNAGELLEELKLNPQTVIILRNGTVVLEDERLKDGDEIELLSTCPSYKVVR